jgi:hypothetical protein
MTRCWRQVGHLSFSAAAWRERRTVARDCALPGLGHLYQALPALFRPAVLTRALGRPFVLPTPRLTIESSCAPHPIRAEADLGPLPNPLPNINLAGGGIGVQCRSSGAAGHRGYPCRGATFFALRRRSWASERPTSSLYLNCPLLVAPDIAFVAFPRLDQLTFCGHLRHLLCSGYQKDEKAQPFLPAGVGS